MKYAIKYLSLSAGAALLASCGGMKDKDTLQSASSPQGGQAVTDYPQKIGSAYQVDGKTYTPADVVAYDEVGYASFYGAELAGRPTANGEIFNPQGISGAHKTLPLPSYVEVTALDTGRTILLRVNDRGPFANDRLIDLSAGAARELGIMEQGVSGVRVRMVNPPEQERAALRAGLSAQQRIETPESLLKILRGNLAKLPKPVNVNPSAVRPPVVASNNASPTTTRNGRFIREGNGPVQAAPVRNTPPPTAARDGGFVREGAGAVIETPTASGEYVVQVASFSSRSRADALARKLGANVMPSSDGRLFRVRYGPYATEVDAQQGLATARKRGYSQAKIFRQ